MFRIVPLNRGRRRSRRLKAEQGAVPDNGIALERREAPGPTLLGPRARKRQPLVTGDLPWRAPDPGFGSGTGGDPPVAPPGAPFPRFEGDGKRGKGGPGSPRSEAAGQRSVGCVAAAKGGTLAWTAPQRQRLECTMDHEL